MTTRPTHQGFGLLEVVIASGILAMVVGAATSLIRSSLRRTILASDRTVAMNLAQASIEQLRSARDSTFIDQNPATNWDAHLPVSCDVQLPATVNQACSLKITLPQGAAGWPNPDPTIGVDTVTEGNQTFHREIYISVPPASYLQSTGIVGVNVQDVVRKVNVIVRWDNDTQAVESETYLTNWRSGV